MDMYMERRLTSLHHAGSKAGFSRYVLVISVAAAIIVILPCIHLGVLYYVWARDKPSVDRLNCKCDCFDTIFRGLYEWPPSSYKHMYFNSTKESLGMWILVVLGVLGLYETVRYLVPLMIQKQIRGSMFALFVSSVYPHYYGWWGLINYLNEEFYPQWWHQIFFSVTELASTALVLHLCNKQARVEPWKLLLIFDINLMHIIIGSLDQFINNILYGNSQVFEAVRDFGLLIPDLFHVLLCFFEIGALAEKKKTQVIRLFYREEITGSLVMITLLSLIGKNM